MQYLQVLLRIAVIIIAAAALLWLVKVLRGRIAALLAHRSFRGNAQERENRAQTLAAAFANTATVATLVSAGLMLISELGFDIKPIVGGAAVAGLAVAFGAQNLMKDYFAGFMILLENQYALNDTITVAGVSGTVERITLRITVLRDQDGSVHFIPNGQIAVVSNRTQGWSRAIVEVRAPESLDEGQVAGLIRDIVGQARKDPAMAELILDDGEMLAPDDGEHGRMIKFAFKTLAGKQATVKRELERRIGNRIQTGA